MLVCVKPFAVIALLLVSATCASTAAASAPSDFTENATLNAKASYVAGKSVHVYCAATDAAWTTFVESSGVTLTDVHGLTPTIGGTETYIDRAGCKSMLARIQKKSVSSWAILGAAIDVLAHESFHMKGVADEGQTECDAIRSLPTFLVARWGFKKNGPTYARVMAGAWSLHHRSAPQYQTVC